MQNQCAAPNCLSGKTTTEPLFRFPLDPERCKTWVENCNRQDLKDKKPEQLYRYYRLCGKHFEQSSIEMEGQIKVLKGDATPTSLEGLIHSQNGQQKRNKEMSKEDEADDKRKKKVKPTQEVTEKEDVPSKETNPVGDEYREYIKSLFEVFALLGEQNIPLEGIAQIKQDDMPLSNFHTLLEYRMNCGDEVLKKRYDANPEKKEFCSAAQLKQMIEVCEECSRNILLEEIKEMKFFSLVTDDVMMISGEWHLPVFLRYIDQVNCQQERFLGFLSFEGDEDTLADKLLAELTDKWGLNMDNCRGQAHSFSGTHCNKFKSFATKVTEKYPMAVLTPKSNSALNVTLAEGMAVSGVQLVMSTFKRIEALFTHSPLLTVELENAISVFYPDKEEKANELKEICRTNWTTRHDAFEVAVDILEALLLCMDSVNDNEDTRWGDQVTHKALEISKAVADFEFVMALIVLKNLLTLTRAFGKNIQGSAAECCFAAQNYKAVVHSLKEVSDNIDVYHEFWHDEAVNLAAVLEIPVKVPRSFSRRNLSETGSVIGSETYYKNFVSVPVVNHVLKELNDLFSENHLKALGCLSLIPTLIEQNKNAEPEEENVQMYIADIPNAATLSAELHCWWVKWSHKNKDDIAPSSLQETLQQTDVKFFPNMLAVLRVISTLPTMVLENSSNDTLTRFKMYKENTSIALRSKSLALLNINCDLCHDLDFVVDMYMKKYPEKEDI